MTLANKKALVIGASSGIGEAIALALAKAGASVAVSARRQDRLDRLVAAIESAGGSAIALPGDAVTDAARLVDAAVSRFGRLDILVNSAGILEAGGVEALSSDRWRQVLDINLMATIDACRAAFAVMKQQGGGDIINISSTAGRLAVWQFAAYATSKFGLTGFTETLRQEGGSAGIRVAIVEPGSTATEIADDITNDQWRDTIREKTHREAAMQPSDIADAVLLIVSLPRRANVSRIMLQPTIDTAPMA